jgi:hypothetical protein
MNEPIHVTIQGDADDPRFQRAAPPGIVIHRSPALHPDDLAVVRGIPVTSLARTLVDLAETSDEDELRGYFVRARRLHGLDIAAVRASADRAEWRPSLPMLYRVIEEFERLDQRGRT